MKYAKILLLLSGLSITPVAQSGTFTTYTTTWNNLSRQYAVYVPTSLPSNPSMVLFLHATSYTAAAPYQMVSQWEASANQNSFLMVWPVSTYEPHAKAWFWDAYDMDFSFTAAPDDAGFLRNLITTLVTQYSVNPNAVFVTGMSSGALMTHRVGVQLSDLVAAIAPVSGQLYMKQITDCFSPPNPVSPVSVLELHGDADTTLPYCGSQPHVQWGANFLTLPSVDVDMNYWIQANSCSSYSTQPLCTNGAPTAGVNGQDATGCNGGVEVKFVRELGVGHVWGGTTINTVWQFFSAHPKP